jgi:hypothetical protein
MRLNEQQCAQETRKRKCSNSSIKTGIWCNIVSIKIYNAPRFHLDMFMHPENVFV